MRFKIDWASLIVGSKFTVFALFYFVFEGNFPSTSPGGQFNGGFFALPVWGLIFGGAYTWRGLFLEFYGMHKWVLEMSIWGVYNYCAIEWNIICTLLFSLFQ